MRIRALWVRSAAPDTAQSGGVRSPGPAAPVLYVQLVRSRLAVATDCRVRRPRPTPPTHLHTVFGTAPHAPLAHPVPHQKAKVWGAKWVRAVGADICAARRRALTRPGGTHVDGLAYAVVSGGRGMTRQGSSYFPELAPGEEIESLPRES